MVKVTHLDLLKTERSSIVTGIIFLRRKKRNVAIKTVTKDVTALTGVKNDT
jgi:hypothetical protein